MAPKIIAVCNQKGGVGKTTLTVNLADVIARRGLDVLVIDADPQANATAHLDVSIDPSMLTLNDILSVKPQSGAVIPGGIADAIVAAGPAWGLIGGHLCAVPAELGLASREQDQTLAREYRLRSSMTGGVDDFDVVLIDCPPSLGQLTVNALIAAQAALLVTEPRAASVEGLAQMVRTLGTVREHFNPALRLAGIVVNKYRPARKDATAWIDVLTRDYGDAVLEPFVPEREAVAAASSSGQPLLAGRGGTEVVAALEAIADQLIKEED